ncbi:hypothetical protein [Aestuariivivens sediminis]|uniref:hypothetical protein n=1 Tax=Aestuariivivens sediminis TaxID=2913557 RepID=UPI001F5A6489|nr:hypothetical protein [Aestuariivivens sediminis]
MPYSIAYYCLYHFRYCQLSGIDLRDVARRNLDHLAAYGHNDQSIDFEEINLNTETAYLLGSYRVEGFHFNHTQNHFIGVVF